MFYFVWTYGDLRGVLAGLVQEMQVWTLSQEDPLETEMATHSSIPAWEILQRNLAATIHEVAESDMTKRATCMQTLEKY